MQILKNLPIAATMMLGVCSTPHPGIEVRTIEVPVEIQKPCPGVVPERPAALEKPLPADANALAAVLGAKLIEWAGPGKYGDRAEAYFKACPPTE